MIFGYSYVGMVKNKKQSKKYKISALLVALLLIVGVGFAIWHHASSDSTTQPGTVNLSPPTKEDAQRVDATKQAIVDRDKQNASSSSQTQNGKKLVKPTITYAGQYYGSVEVGGYVSGIFEEGGTCTATFTNGSNNFSKDASAVRNANSVSCPTISVPANQFSPKGAWSVVLGYSSTTASGNSDAQSVEVK